MEKGWVMAGEPAGFLVRTWPRTPLKRGEMGRAAAWARELVASLT